MNPKISRWLATFALFEWGGVFIYFYWSGRITHFLHPSFQPWVLVAGILMMITGAFIFFSGTDGCAHDHEGGESCDHDHGTGQTFDSWKWTRMMILLIPMGSAALFSPDRFGETFVQNRKAITTPAEIPGSFKPDEPQTAQLSFESNQPAVAPVALVQTKKPKHLKSKVKAEEASIMDLIYSAGVVSEREQMEGKMISVIGQVAKDRDQGIRVGNFAVYQLVIVCCAADAQPVSIRINYPDLDPNLKNTDWVKVTGKLHFIPTDPSSVVIVTAIDVEEVAAPPDSQFTP